MEYVVELRRFFHKYPELSGKEENTSSKIKEELSRLKISYESVGEYGVIGILKGENRGKTIALRADIDALPIREDNKNLMKDKTVVSSIQGVCHACGHDAHIAMLLSSAHKLSEMREEINTAQPKLTITSLTMPQFSYNVVRLNSASIKASVCSWECHPAFPRFS